ncbi:MAG: zinc finger domain-containing protein, partial [Primorskyibacter sp.]
TMEDVWLDRFPGEEASVHLQDIPETPAGWRNDTLATKWQAIRKVRRVVTGALEEQRRNKVIGSSLEAAPVVYLGNADLCTAVADVDFEDLCIVSGLDVQTCAAPEGAFMLEEQPDVAVVFAKADGEKCQRCWKILPDVGNHSQTGTCGRCDAALTGATS